MKKLFLGLGTATAVLAPIVSVVSCANTNSKETFGKGKITVYYDVVGKITGIYIDSNDYLKKDSKGIWTIDQNGIKKFIADSLTELLKNNKNAYNKIADGIQELFRLNISEGFGYFGDTFYFVFGHYCVKAGASGAQDKYLLKDGQYIWGDKTTKSEDDKGWELGKALFKRVEDFKNLKVVK